MGAGAVHRAKTGSGARMDKARVEGYDPADLEAGDAQTIVTPPVRGAWRRSQPLREGCALNPSTGLLRFARNDGKGAVSSHQENEVGVFIRATYACKSAILVLHFAMAYCVFMHRSDSIYDDSPAVHYQFPSQYLRRVDECAGDWIVYLEPRRVRDSRGYFAVARVERIIKDPKAPAMYLALIEPGSYLEFPNPVPFNQLEGPVERGLLNEAGKLSGRAQSAVRPIAPADFVRILELGLEDIQPVLPRVGYPEMSGFEEPQSPMIFEQDREIIQNLTSKLVRSRVFRQIVLRAYDERCAITGLKFINGGGRAEVDAAHIRPVEKNGPDIVNNGLALSGTAHWMFDRGLISLNDNLEILVSRHVNDVESVRGFINKSGMALLPRRSADRPHPHFLNWHRENCFKR